MYEEREYLIFNVSELNKVNFNEILETSEETIVKSIDQTKTFIKWDGTTPSFVNTLTTKEGPYTRSEMLDILKGSAWLDENQFTI